MALFFLLCVCCTTGNAIPSVHKKQLALSSIARRVEETQTTFNASKSKAVNLHKSRDAVGFPGVIQEIFSLINVLKNRDGQKDTRMSRKHRRNRSKKATDRKNQRRRHKGLSRKRVELEQKSCPTRTNYVFKKTAEDIFGDKVDVYPVITTGNLAMDQYFYEIFCNIERCTCSGINSQRFKSSCKTTHSYTYAKIVKSGEIGWSYIKVRSGCSCVIQEKTATSALIEDLIAHDRT